MSWCYLANFPLPWGGQQSCTFCVGHCQALFTVIIRSQEKAGEFLAVCGRGERYSCRAVVVITPIHHYPSHHESPPDNQPLCLHPSHLENLCSHPVITSLPGKTLAGFVPVFLPQTQKILEVSLLREQGQLFKCFVHFHLKFNQSI